MLSFSSPPSKRNKALFALSFFLFGTINNILYVVILSAALDLVDKASTPKGLILFVNIAPALLVKIGWPYFVPGPTRYGRRVVSCSLLSFVGILIVAFSASLGSRLLGIAIASFSSGLGEMTYLQRATVYGSLSSSSRGKKVNGEAEERQEDLGGIAVGWFSSGTGAAGIGGAGIWWLVRGLGVRVGLGVCSFLPLCMSLTYFLLLPPLSTFRSASSAFPPASSSADPSSSSPLLADPSASDGEDVDSAPNGLAPSSREDEDEEAYLARKELEDRRNTPSLTTREKVELARPLVKTFMLPLFFVYLAEYTINSGVAPTLLYEVPTKENAPVLHLAIKSLRDYYPLWQLLYQTFVFLSRSSLSLFHLPPLPLRLLPLPTLLQLGILFITLLEASTSFLPAFFLGEHGATWVVAGLICCEGLCGGAAYVNAFHRLAVMEEEEEDGEDDGDARRREVEKEFQPQQEQDRMPDAAQVAARPPPPSSSSSAGVLIARSLVKSSLSSAPTLLPPHLAQLITALSLCARVSLRASALFLEAILESVQYTTVTGLGVTRRALIAAVGSARAMHYVKEGLDWSGRNADGEKSQDTFLQVLEKWTNLGTYFIHHTFTLAELFTMSGFYLTLNTLQTGFSAAEESVRLLDSILGSNESSRALSSIITLVRSELTREDPRYSKHGAGLLGDIERDDDEQGGEGGGENGEKPSKSTVASLTALTKALTAFACLQTATHRRTLKTLKLRVVYDCTVVVEDSKSTTYSSSSSVSDPPTFSPASSASAVLPSDPGKYAGPPAPPRAQIPVPRPHQRAKSASALSITPLSPSLSDSAVKTTRRSRESSASPSISGGKAGGGSSGSEILTDVRSELEKRASARLGSPACSRRSSVVLDNLDEDSTGLGLATGSAPSSPFEEDLPDVRLQGGAESESELLKELDEDATEEEIMTELDELCAGGVGDELSEGVDFPSPGPSRPRSTREGYEGDAEADEAGEGEEYVVPLAVQLALQEIDAHYSASAGLSPPSLRRQNADFDTADEDSLPSSASTLGFFPPSATITPPPSLASSAFNLPHALPNSHDHRPVAGSGRYSYEVSVSETTTTRTTTTTVRAVEHGGRRSSRTSMPGALGGMDLSESEGSSGEGEKGEEEWADVATMFSRSRQASDSPDLGRPEGGESATGYESGSSMSEAYEDARGLPSSPNGARVGGRGGRLGKSVASLSRIETLERPEESRQKLQVVLSTMTKKFTQRKRTVRRYSPSPSSANRSFTHSPAPSSSTAPTPTTHSPSAKRRWPGSRRSSTSNSSTSTARPASPPPTPAKKGKSSVLKAAMSKAFRQRQHHEDDHEGPFMRPIASDGFETVPSSTATTPTIFLSPTTECDEPDLYASSGSGGSGSGTAYQTARGTPAPPSSAAPGSRTRTPSAEQLPSNSPFRPPQHLSSHMEPKQPSPHVPSSSSSSFRPTASPPLARPSVRRATSVQTLRSTVTTTTCTHAPRNASEAREHEGGKGHFPPRHLVENLQRFARYSSAAYGQSFLRILGIGKHEFKFPHTQHHANNHAFAHHVGIHVEDILLSSFTDPQPAFAEEKISPIVNYVAVDHSISAIVLACRGSLGLSDILVDLTCSYEPIPVQDGDPHGAYFVHSGMFCSATTLQRGTVHDVVKEALEQFPTYGLVICGHSLGGGVASLLSILWSSPVSAFERNRAAFEQARGRRVSHPPITIPFVTSFSSGLPPGRPISCYTYGVPCVASPDLVAYCRGLVISTVNSWDIVPTLSLGTLRDFKSMATGFYAEQGTCEEIVGRVIGLCQRRFMAKRAERKKKKAEEAAAARAASGGGTGFSFSPFSSPPRTAASSPPPAGAATAPSPGEDLSLDSLTDPSDESRLVPLTPAEIDAGRGTNKALEPSYQDPSLLGPDDLVADDVELSQWLWSLKTTIRANSDNDKLYPPGTVYVVEQYTVFITSESSASGKYSRREGRRVLLRAVDDVERRFSEPVFSRTMLSDHSPANYETCCDLLATAVL
ncbi:hypothetical protein JCM8547_005287 [Rhodosporidiobolus lusitaniae]